MHSRASDILVPRHWPLWLGLGAMRLMSALPYAWQLGLGRLTGSILGRVARRRLHIASINIGLCLDDLDRRQLLARHMAALGIGFFETASAWWSRDEQLRTRVRLEGLEHLDAALAQGRGVILLTGHFTHLELGARFIAMHRPFHAMYRPHKNPLYESVMRRWRERRSGHPPIPRDDLRGVLRALRRGDAVWYAPDQNYGSKHAVFVPFFGVPALTITATSRIAAASGARVVPYYPRRLPGRGGYQVTILPALEDFPGPDSAADARRINALLEDWIREAPEQYLWVHRRFKTRPPGAPKLY